MTQPLRHFLDLDVFDTPTLRHLLERGRAFKAGEIKGLPLRGRMLALVFEKPSTRTRVSFEAGMMQLGGATVVMDGQSSQIGRGETIADTARVLSRYVDAIMFRTGDPAKMAELAAHAGVPVINGLTDRSHPCQVMADIMTFEEHRGPIAGRIAAWSGDGNNVALSWIHAAVRFGFTLRLACPEGLEPAADVLAWAKAEGGDVHLVRRPEEAVDGAACVVTDTWVSMNHSDGARDRRIKMLEPYRVDEALMARAASDAVFMHCLPAHRGEEVTDAVIDGPHSVVWDEAENRMHIQKAILAWCLDAEAPVVAAGV